MVLELRLGVERLGRRRSDDRRRRRRRGASGEGGKKGAGDDGAKAFGHQRGLLIIRRGAGPRREQRLKCRRKARFQPLLSRLAQDRPTP
jgi:hypothetical protein